MSPVHDTVLGANSASMKWGCFGTNSISSPLPQGFDEIASCMRTSELIASRRRLAARFFAAHNFDNFRSIFRLRAFQYDTISCDPLLQSEVTHD